jgi:hypothetical protein
MALTLVRPEARAERALPRTVSTVVHVTTGPVGVLAAACLLTTGFLVAVSDLVARLG